MSKPYVRAAILDDIQEVASRMRAEDVEEIKYVSNSTPIDSLMNGYRDSDMIFTIVHQDKPIAIFGVVYHSSTFGVPWMLATDELKDIKKSFLKECRKYLAILMGTREVLANIVWEKNTVHIKWLKWLGFKFDEQKVMINGEFFLPFSMYSKR